MNNVMQLVSSNKNLDKTEGKVPTKTGIVRKDRLPILKPPEIEFIYDGNT